MTLCFDTTQQLLFHQEMMAKAQNMQRFSFRLGAPSFSPAILENSNVFGLSSHIRRSPPSALKAPIFSPSSNRDVLASIFLMRQQEKLSVCGSQNAFACGLSSFDAGSMFRAAATPDENDTKATAQAPLTPAVDSSEGEATPHRKCAQNTSKKESKWLSMLEQLKTYKSNHGSCVVPRGFPENPRLASWVAEQRKQFKLLKDGKASSITSERVSLLDGLGFVWNAQGAAWERHISDLCTFRKENGHCHVPLNYDRFPKLGLWIKEQRRHYTLMKQGKPSHMTEERIEELDALGFCWDTHEATWMERLRELSEFKEKYGACVVPTSYEDNPKLGTWVHHQRRQYKKFKEGKPSHITEERIKALESLGFVWYPRERSTRSLSDDSSRCSSSDSDVESLESRPTKKRRTSTQ